jgi:hypothetical protein
MTAGGTANEAPAFPAPGSAVPGAPPALKRALVPADGVPIGMPTLRGDPVEDAGERPAAHLSGSPLIAAAAMLGIAVGLELAGRLPSRSRGRRSPRNWR